EPGMHAQRRIVFDHDMRTRILGLAAGDRRGVRRFGAVKALHAMRAVTKWFVLGQTAAAQGVAVSAGEDLTFLPGQGLAMLRHHGRLPHQGNTTFYHIGTMLTHGNFACRLCHGTLLVIKMQPSQRAYEPLRQKEPCSPTTPTG